MSSQNQENNNGNNNKPNRWIVLSGLGFQMGATIFICAWGGKKLDAYYWEGDQNYFTIGLVLFGVVASLFVIIKQLNRLN